MKLSEQLKRDHECGDFGNALRGYSERAAELEAQVEWLTADLESHQNSAVAKELIAAMQELAALRSELVSTSAYADRIVDEKREALKEIDAQRSENQRLTAELAETKQRLTIEEAHGERYQQELAALRSQQAAVPAWQPIETAPKDGVFILVWNMHGINEVFWNDEEEWWHHDVEFDHTFPLRGDLPTHWMPLPAAPEAPQPSQQVGEAVGEIVLYTGSGELRGAKWQIAAPFPTVAWKDGKQPPIGTKLYTAPQPIQSEDARDAAYAAFDSWWDGVEQIETPETYLGWRESCRKAWYAGVASAMSKHGATPDEPVCCVADLNENVRSQMLEDGYLLSDGLFAAMQKGGA